MTQRYTVTVALPVEVDVLHRQRQEHLGIRHVDADEIARVESAERAERGVLDLACNAGRRRPVGMESHGAVVHFHAQFRLTHRQSFDRAQVTVVDEIDRIHLPRHDRLIESVAQRLRQLARHECEAVAAVDVVDPKRHQQALLQFVARAAECELTVDGRVAERAGEVVPLHRQVAGHEPDQHAAFEVLELGRVFVEIEKAEADLIAVQDDLYAAFRAGHFCRCVAHERHALPVLERNRRHIRFVVELAIVEVVAQLRAVDAAARIESAEPGFHTAHAGGRVAHDADHRCGVERGQGGFQTRPTRQTALRRHNGFVEAHAAVCTHYSQFVDGQVPVAPKTTRRSTHRHIDRFELSGRQHQIARGHRESAARYRDRRTTTARAAVRASHQARLLPHRTTAR